MNSQIQGTHLIDGADVDGPAGAARFQARSPGDGAELEPGFPEASQVEIDAALTAARQAAPILARLGTERLARFVAEIATQIEALGDPLLERCEAETGLPRPRLEMERGRTCNQLRMFAGLLASGEHLQLCIEHGDPQRRPIPKPDLRRMQRPLGPVVVFGASNFPLAFSVAGGDTAAALAAGCPVIVKGHPAHPGTSEMVGRAVQAAAQSCEVPAGVFALLQSCEPATAAALVQHPDVSAVAFTGSLAAGRQIFDLCRARAVPIPCFAEMGSINPVFVLPGALAAGGESLAEGLAGSVQLGVGQFCTNPGLVVYCGDASGEAFARALQQGMQAGAPGTMLHAGIAASYAAAVAAMADRAGVEVLHRGDTGAGQGAPALFRVDAQDFLADPALREELFGPATLMVRCKDEAEMLLLAENLDGQLTATIHASEAELAGGTALLEVLAERVGRLLFGGMPTGVEVNAAMQHGGPYPASTDAQSTSVGTAAIARFLRPVAYQNLPDSLLPPALQEANPCGYRRLVDGSWQGGGAA